MNELQTFFTIVFGIYFAATVSTSGRFWPFDTSAAFGGDLRSVARLIVAIVFLDIAPFAYLILALCHLQGKDEPLLQSPFTTTLSVFGAALGGAGIYRIFASLMLVRRRGSSSEFVFYSSAHELRRAYMKEGACRKQPPEDVRHYPVYPVFLGGVAWLLLCIAPFLWLTR